MGLCRARPNSALDLIRESAKYDMYHESEHHYVNVITTTGGVQETGLRITAVQTRRPLREEQSSESSNNSMCSIGALMLGSCTVGGRRGGRVIRASGISIGIADELFQLE